MRTLGLRALAGGIAVAAGFDTLEAQVQVREGARSSHGEAQVTFGYVCDDRFVVQNDGDETVKLEYGLDRSDDRTPLTLKGKESVELLLSTTDELNLMADGKVIATAHNEGRECDEERPRVVVVRRPIVRVEPTVIVVRPRPYYTYYDDPWWHQRRRTVVHTTVIRFPIIINARSRDRGRDNDRGRDGGRDRDRGNSRSRGRGR